MLEKSFLFKFIIVNIVIVSLVSCSIEKRKHRRGYRVEWSKKQAVRKTVSQKEFFLSKKEIALNDSQEITQKNISIDSSSINKSNKIHSQTSTVFKSEASLSNDYTRVVQKNTSKGYSVSTSINTFEKDVFFGKRKVFQKKRNTKTQQNLKLSDDPYEVGEVLLVLLLSFVGIIYIMNMYVVPAITLSPILILTLVILIPLLLGLLYPILAYKKNIGESLGILFTALIALAGIALVVLFFAGLAYLLLGGFLIYRIIITLNPT